MDMRILGRVARMNVPANKENRAVDISTPPLRMLPFAPNIRRRPSRRRKVRLSPTRSLSRSTAALRRRRCERLFRRFEIQFCRIDATLTPYRSRRAIFAARRRQMNRAQRSADPDDNHHMRASARRVEYEFEAARGLYSGLRFHDMTQTPEESRITPQGAVRATRKPV